MKGESDNRKTLLNIYRLLLYRYGPQHWWPAESAFEVIIGAILTQSAAWTNVEKAIANLKAAEVLTPSGLRRLPIDQLARLIYPSGYYNAKAVKIRSFVHWLGDNYSDDLERLFALDIPSLRESLLSIPGVGEETADSIILYAAEKPIFIIDAYTRRILHRLNLHPTNESYAAFQALFMDNLPRDQTLFNEYHALIVHHGKEICRKMPFCSNCCLNHLCSTAEQSGSCPHY